MNSSRQHYQLGGHLKIFENSFYVSFDARNNLTINYNKFTRTTLGRLNI